MHISGAHFNPAVTIAILATGRIKGGPALFYIIAQLLGGVVAGFLLAYVFAVDATGGVDVVSAVKLGTPSVAAGVSMSKAIVIEAVMTFLLVFVIFGTAVDPRAPKIGGFGIGLVVAADIMMAGPLTGASMNPARTIGTGLPAFLNGFEGFWAEQPIYWIGPVVGGLLAALIYHHFLMGRDS
jgi:MIP family channel proteins